MKPAFVSFCLLLFGCVAFSQQPDRASVVFLFPTAGTIVHSPIYVDGADVAHLKPNHWLKMELPAGEHSFAGKRKEEGADCTLEAAKTYYFVVHNYGITEGMILEPTSAEIAKYDIRNLQEQTNPK